MYFIHYPKTQKLDQIGAPGPASVDPWRPKSGTFCDFLTFFNIFNIFKQNIQKVKGDPLAKKIEKKIHSVEKTGRGILWPRPVLYVTLKKKNNTFG